MQNNESWLPAEAAVSQFIERITKADGELIHLPGKKSKLAEPFFISARLGEDEYPLEDGLRYLNVDIFIQRDGEYVPIGIYDWEIRGDKAVGNKQRHQHLPCVNEAQVNADRFWANEEAFQVVGTDYLKYAEQNGGFGMMSTMREQGLITSEEQWGEKIYQGEGLGSLMIAVSSLTLEAHGIKDVNLGTLSPPAKGAWKKFDRGERVELPVEDITSHSVTREVVAGFITGKP